MGQRPQSLCRAGLGERDKGGEREPASVGGARMTDDADGWRNIVAGGWNLSRLICYNKHNRASVRQAQPSIV
jgi:hypothetical protein